ncbi:MAG: filamentous hemagglutinin N-terminal domain-containing protein [Candidatus Competibacter sp.]|jgi:filamentous hemagglutinin family protein|nr:filamentous hemagglutinin N-terminal domain-containing protein [Candidatus Competibacter sp.]
MNTSHFTDTQWWLIGIVATAFTMTIALPTHAGVTTDGTLGQGGALPGPNYQIPADLGQQVGGNLFHSFGQFSIDTGESATFSGPNSVNNIIGRVTGGEASFIDGTIRSTIPGANLYLLNPAGLLFGENVTLDVSGSVHVSTADYLRLGDGGRFDAHTPGNSVLTVAPVAAFGFLDPPAPITVNGGFLRVPDGQTLSLIGGDITLNNATLYTPAGRIDLAAVGSAGEVLPTDHDLVMQGFDTLGALTIERDPVVARVTVDIGEPLGKIPLGDLDTSGEGGGAIFIRGGRWVSRGGWVLTNTYGTRAGRDVDVAIAGNVRFDQGALLGAGVLGSGTGGSISFSAHDLNILDGSGITTETFGSGNAGDVTITVRNVLVDRQNAQSDTGIGSITESGSTGDGGAVKLTVADNITVQNGGQVGASTSGAGNAGDLTITARNLLIDGQNAKDTGIGSITGSGSTGNGGVVKLTVADNITVQNGGAISAVTSGDGNAGDVTITARNLLVDRQNARSPTGIFSSAERSSKGDGGTVNLNLSGTLTARNGGEIRASTFGAGNAGDVTITARNLLVDGQNAPSFTGIASSVADVSTGDGGTINLTIADTLTVLSGGQVGASTFGTGEAGDVTITARNLLIDGQNTAFFTGIDSTSTSNSTGDGGTINLSIADTLTVRNGGQISAASATTSGGNITLDVARLRLFNGGAISATVYGGFDTEGGNVTINSGNIVALNGSTITAQANQGRGGNILINAGVFLHDAASTDQVLNASSRITGNDGTVQNNAPNTDLSGSLTVLPTNYLSAADQLGDRCETSDPDSRSRFIVQGRGGLLPGPDDPATAHPVRCRAAPPTLSEATPPALSSASTLVTAAQGFGNR